MNKGSDPDGSPEVVRRFLENLDVKEFVTANPMDMEFSDIGPCEDDITLTAYPAMRADKPLLATICEQEGDFFAWMFKYPRLETENREIYDQHTQILKTFGTTERDLESVIGDYYNLFQGSPNQGWLAFSELIGDMLINRDAVSFVRDLVRHSDGPSPPVFWGELSFNKGTAGAAPSYMRFSHGQLLLTHSA